MKAPDHRGFRRYDGPNTPRVRSTPEYEEHDDGENKYYFLLPSGMSTWTRPKYPSPEELEEIQRKVRTADPALVWECCREDGTLFYYNPFTGMSQWTHPGEDAVITFVSNDSDDDDEAPGAPAEDEGPVMGVIVEE